jgi:hypothetical protein
VYPFKAAQLNQGMAAELPTRNAGTHIIHTGGPLSIHTGGPLSSRILLPTAR